MSLDSFDPNGRNVTRRHSSCDVLMQIEAILFASDSPVSLARLKEAFQNQYNKQQLSVLATTCCATTWALD